MSRAMSGLSALSRLGVAIGASVLAGALLAGLALPLIGGAGLAAKAGSDDFLALPAELATPPLSTRSRVLAADGSVLATFYSVNRISAPFDQIPVSTRQAVVAIEDSRFYEHHGVDFKGTLRALVADAQTGHVAQGGSTLTQQYVKNALIQAASDKAGQQAAQQDTADRKLREARYALELERKLPKDEILHRYLEVAYYGNGVYGIGTAANYYFNKSVKDLTLAESAVLAGVVQNPTRYDVDSKDPAVRQDVVDRRNTVLGRMAELGDIDQPSRVAAAAEPLAQVNPVIVGSGCEDPSVVAPFFCDHVRHELEDTEVGAALGATKEERQATLFGGGLTIRTNLDLRVQAAAQATLAKQLPATDPSGVAGVTDIVEPGTGKVKAMAVNRPYGDDPAQGATKVNLAEGGTYGYQPGSTFKPFFLAEALRQGLPLDTQIDSPASYSSQVFKDCSRSCRPYVVGNAGDSEAGTFDFRSGTHASVNTFYIQVEERTGIEKPAALAEAMGVREINRGVEQPLPRVPSLVLGSAGVSPLAMAGAYATFAAHGLFCPPRAVLDITGPNGAPVPVPAPGCAQVLDPGIADTVTSVLTGVIDGNDPGRTAPNASISRDAAGKTGTTSDSTAAWFVGYTPQLSTAVWIGKIKPTPLHNIRINGRSYGVVYGATISAPIWRDTMSASLAGLPELKFTVGDAGTGTLNSSNRSGVPDVTGRSVADALQQLSAAGFTAVQGRAIPSRQRVGRVAATSPRAGSKATPGATIYVYRSSGQAAAPTQRAARQATAPALAPPRQPSTAAVVPPPAPAPVQVSSAPPPPPPTPVPVVTVTQPPAPSPTGKGKGKGKA